MSEFVEDINSRPVLINLFSEDPDYLYAWSESFDQPVLRNSTKFLSTTKEFYDGTKDLQYQAFGCKVKEEASIRQYTSSGTASNPGYYSGLNKALLGLIDMTPEYSEFTEVLNAGLNKLPNYSGDVFRGLGEVESNIALQWNKGDIVNAEWF